MNTSEANESLNEKLWMKIVAESEKGVITVDILEYATAEHLNNDLLERLGEFEIKEVLSNFKGEDFVEGGRVLDGVFDLILSEELTVGEWLVLEAWAYIQATHTNFETDKLIDGMREAYIGIFKNTEELAKHHVNNIDTSSYNEIIMSNIDYAAMDDDILWRGLYHSVPVKNSALDENYFFNR